MDISVLFCVWMRAGRTRDGEACGTPERGGKEHGTPVGLGRSPASSSEAGRAYLEEGGTRGDDASESVGSP